LSDKHVKKVRAWTSKLGDYIFSKLSASPVVRKITPEQEEKLINQMAMYIAKYKMETPAGFFLGAIKPFSYVVSNLIILPASPFFYLFGLDGYRYVDFFEKPENVKRLINKLEELQLNRESFK